LEEAARLLEKMAQQLRSLKAQRSKVPASRPTAEVPSAGVPEGVRVGSRVRVIRKDRYQGRTGVVLRRHGRLFWDVQLDATATQSKCLIYKKDASLCVVGSPGGGS
jgi:ribosomal protein L19